MLTNLARRPHPPLANKVIQQLVNFSTADFSDRPVPELGQHVQLHAPFNLLPGGNGPPGVLLDESARYRLDRVRNAEEVRLAQLSAGIPSLRYSPEKLSRALSRRYYAYCRPIAQGNAVLYACEQPSA